MANYTYGPRGLDLLSNETSAEQTIKTLTSANDGREHRQIGVVDSNGRAATFTGSECFDWAGGVTGEHYTAQGNILVGVETVEAMANAYETNGGDFAGRLLSALEAGQAEGGDRRGQQSAALLVVRESGGYGGDNDRVVDLRVDEHPYPIRELIRIRNLHSLYFGETQEVVPVEGEVRREIEEMLLRLGYLEQKVPEDEALFDAVSAYHGTENFEEREQERGYLDIEVLRFMRDGH